MRGKIYKQLRQQAPTDAVKAAEAIAWIKENVKGKFDQTVEVHIHLGIDASKSDQMVRGSVTFPAGTPKQKKVIVLSSDSKKQAEGKAAGAISGGGDELIAKILEDKNLDADVLIATPEMMPKIAKAAKILGPKGLMPNPKNGTVTLDIAKAVAELIGGKVTFKMDQTGNIHEAVGKVSWDAAKIAQNVEALVAAVRQAKPSSQKGEYLKRVAIKATMSPALVVAA